MRGRHGSRPDTPSSGNKGQGQRPLEKARKYAGNQEFSPKKVLRYFVLLREIHATAAKLFLKILTLNAFSCIPFFFFFFMLSETQSLKRFFFNL